MLEQIRQIVGDQVDDVHLQGIRGTQALRRAHGVFGPVGVAAAQFCQAPDVGDRVIDGLALGCRRRGRDQIRGLHCLVCSVVGFGAVGFAVLRVGVIRFIAIRRFALLVGSTGVLVSLVLVRIFARGIRWRSRRGRADGHRSRRAEIGRGGHCSDVACIKNIGAGTRRARALGPHVGGDRHLRRENALDDLAHGRIQPAGSIHLQHDQGRIGLLRRLDAARDEIRSGRPDRALDLQQRYGPAAPGRVIP